jgi:hypothetical protein
VESYEALGEIANIRETALQQSRCMPTPYGCGREVTQNVQDLAYMFRSLEDPLSRKALEERPMPFSNGVMLAGYRASSLCEACQGRYIAALGDEL